MDLERRRTVEATSTCRAPGHRAAVGPEHPIAFDDHASARGEQRDGLRAASERAARRADAAEPPPDHRPWADAQAHARASGGRRRDAMRLSRRGGTSTAARLAHVALEPGRRRQVEEADGRVAAVREGVHRARRRAYKGAGRRLDRATFDENREHALKDVEHVVHVLVGVRRRTGEARLDLGLAEEDGAARRGRLGLDREAGCADRDAFATARVQDDGTRVRCAHDAIVRHTAGTVPAGCGATTSPRSGAR